MRRAARVDLNQSPIVKAFRQLGCSVVVTSGMGEGFPDLVVGFMRQNYLIECKSARGKLTPEQHEFFVKWRGQYDVIRSKEEVVEFVKRERKRLYHQFNELELKAFGMVEK